MINSQLNINIRPGIWLQSADIRANPFPTYAYLREHYPVCQVEPDGLWAVSRFAEVKQVLAHPEIFSSSAINLLYQSHWLSEECRNTRPIISQDPPEHKQYHGMVNRAFIHSAIESLVPLMQETAQSLLENLHSTTPVDFAEHFSYPYIGKVIRHLVGVGDKQSLAEIRRWVDLEESVTPLRPDDGFARAFEAVTVRQNRYFLEAAEERRNFPRDDLLTHLMNIRVDGNGLTNKQLCGVLSLVVSAGFATTIQMLNHAIILLAKESGLLARLISSPQLIPAFIEELLRFSPSVLSSLRITRRPVELSGVTIPEGELVMAMLASANRDPLQFSNPDTFDLSRPQNKQHLTFGQGIHTCIGAALARLELKIALETLLSRFSGMDCPPNDQLNWKDSMFVRGVTELPVSFH